MKTFHRLKCHIVGMSKEAYGENGDRVVVQAVVERYKNFVTIAIPSIAITL